MNWFGEPWPTAQFRAPICEDDEKRIPTPVGETCIFCIESIEEDDRGEQLLGGEYVHVECGLRNVTGNHLHVMGKCEHIGHCNEESKLSYREEAMEVWRLLMGAERRQRANISQEEASDGE
jgi:hypothetical protein